MKRQVYDRLTKNLFKHLARGDEVQYLNLLIRKDGDRIVVRGRLEGGEEVELFYRAEKGDMYGLSKEQMKRIVAFKEKPLFRTHIRR